MKKAQMAAAEDSEDDCNVDAEVGEEYNMGSVAKAKKVISY
jgi:hypothetical protein